jgi:hypothetical protein
MTRSRTRGRHGRQRWLPQARPAFSFSYFVLARRLRASLFIFAALCSASLLAQQPQSLQQHALAAYKAKDYPTYLTDSGQIEQQRPGHPIALFNLAGAHALNGDARSATAALDRLADLQVWLDVAGETDFDAVRSDPAFARAAARIASVLETKKSSGTVAFQFDDPDLITESIAYDSRTRSFFVGSVRKRRVFRIAPNGAISELLGPAAGIDAPNGLAVDATRRRLWVASTGSKRVEGFDAAHANPPALVAFSIDSGALMQRIEGAAKQFFDSVAVLDGGDVVVSDSNGSVLVLRKGESALQVLVPPGTLRSPQAIAPLDARTFFVADYGSGIHRVDARTGKSQRLSVPPGVNVYGIDGLTYSGGSLLAIVNGYRPNRVQRLRLDAKRQAIVSAETLEMNTPQLDEPTNATVVGRTYYFVASSQGHRFDGETIDPKSSGKPTIMKIELGK